MAAAFPTENQWLLSREGGGKAQVPVPECRTVMLKYMILPALRGPEPASPKPSTHQRAKNRFPRTNSLGFRV